ncbi:MAG: hypothetical protein N3D15_08025 [Syntrophorhabdaceae bacterium]|nr:hypothetical protein [Syntrophorhabdaceae bacterium]
MEIKIKRLTTQQEREKDNPFEKIHRYIVTENNKSFIILYKSGPHGHSLCLEGQKGILYSDTEKNEVRRQVISLGIDCGLRYESDEPVDGLSPLALRGVVFAEKTHEQREIVLSEDPCVIPKGKGYILSIEGEVKGFF